MGGKKEIEEPGFAAIEGKKKKKKIFLHAFSRKASGTLAHPLIAVCPPAAAHELTERMKPVPPQRAPRASGFS